MRQPFVEKVPGLIQGISKQAPSIRFPGQVADAINVDFNVVDGARKRKGTEWFTQFAGASPAEEYRMHRIERDDEEEYVVVYGGGLWKVVDINTGYTITPTNTPSTYFNQGDPTNPPEKYRLVTIADATFVVNTEAVPSVKANTGGGEINPSNMPVLLKRTQLYDGGGNYAPTFAFENVDWKGRSKNRQIIRANPSQSSHWAIFYPFSAWNGDIPELRTTSLPPDANAQQISDAMQGNGINPDDLVVEKLISRTTSNKYGTWSETKTIYTGEYRCIDPNNRGWGGPPDPWPNGIDDMAVVGLDAFPAGKVVVTGGPIQSKDVIVQISRAVIVDE